MSTFGSAPVVLLPGRHHRRRGRRGRRHCGPQAARDFARDISSPAADARFSGVKIVGIGQGAVVSANLTVEWTRGDVPTTYRVTELLVAHPEDGTLSVLAAALSMPVPSKAAAAHLADADYRPVPMPGATTDVDEQARGLAPARKLLGRWRAIKLAVDGGASQGFEVLAYPGDQTARAVGR